MDPNACVERIALALANNDHEEAEQALQDLSRWLDKMGFHPTNTDKLRPIKPGPFAASLIKLVVMSTFVLRSWPWLLRHPVVNPEHGGEGRPLLLVRLDDRGDLCAFVWNHEADEALELAFSFADMQGWPVTEDDGYVTEVSGGDYEKCLLLTKMLNELTNEDL